MKDHKKNLSAQQQRALLQTLKTRFEKNADRHKGIRWEPIMGRLVANTGRMWTLNEMEETGGEPDVIGHESKTGVFIFCDCAAESPKGRRSLCYDGDALASRKENKPADSAVEMAAAMGIELLSEEEYRALQKLGEFDLKTSSWIKTPDDIRKRGGALFCDRRYGHVFLYHNGAESYYAARGFRGILRV
jgi:hypothetical protein